MRQQILRTQSGLSGELLEFRLGLTQELCGNRDPHRAGKAHPPKLRTLVSISGISTEDEAMVDGVVTRGVFRHPGRTINLFRKLQLGDQDRGRRVSL